MEGPWGVPVEIVSDIEAGKEEKGLGEQQPVASWASSCVSLVWTLAASRVESFSQMLMESLPADVDAVLDEVTTLLHDCLSEDIGKGSPGGREEGAGLLQKINKPCRLCVCLPLPRVLACRTRCIP